MLRSSLHAIGALVTKIDPRVVRLREPRRYPRYVWKVAVIGAIAILGAVSLAATRDKKEPQKKDPLLEHQAKSSNQIKREIKRDFDPIYVFTKEPVRQAIARPISDPRGLVVTLDGAALPQGEAVKDVGPDERIRAVQRWPTDKGLKYVIHLKKPIQKVDTVRDGNVVMIFPRNVNKF